MPHNGFDLTGRVALVTGGSKGLGAAMARGLAEAGADIVIASRSEAELKSSLAEILQGDPLNFQIPYRLGDVVAGNAKPTSTAHKQMMMSGTVGDSVVGSGDFPFDHPFGSDFNMDVNLDPVYAQLAQTAGVVVDKPMHTELSAGLLPHTPHEHWRA